MNQWIESVQKHNGLPQQAIDSLLTMEFEGGENEMYSNRYLDAFHATANWMQALYVLIYHAPIFSTKIALEIIWR